jgi:hypothetical protein
MRDKYLSLAETYTTLAMRDYAQAARQVVWALDQADPRQALTQLALDATNGQVRTFYQQALREGGWATC